MPTGGRIIHWTYGRNMLLNKTKDKATDTNAYITLAYNLDEPCDSRGKGRNNKDATEAIEAPGAPRARRIQKHQ
jgi:hypothetical protein